MYLLVVAVHRMSLSFNRKVDGLNYSLFGTCTLNFDTTGSINPERN